MSDDIPDIISALRIKLPHLEKEPIRWHSVAGGLSGSKLYKVSALTGEWILRVENPETQTAQWLFHLEVAQAAANAQISPQLVAFDRDKRWMLSTFIENHEIAKLCNLPSGQSILERVASKLRLLHQLPRPPVRFWTTKDWGSVEYQWEGLKKSAGLPDYIRDLTLQFLSGPADRNHEDFCLIHFDLNPSNVLWDQREIWFIDWENSGPGHPFFDLATFINYNSLDDDAVTLLLTHYLGHPATQEDRHLLRFYRQKCYLIYGLSFLNSLIDKFDVKSLYPSSQSAQSLKELNFEFIEGARTLASEVDLLALAMGHFHDLWNMLES